jgi:hypothetical protein
MSASRDIVVAWFAEIGWLVVSEGARADGKPGTSIFALSPIGMFRDFRFGANGDLEEIEELR